MLKRRLETKRPGKEEDSTRDGERRHAEEGENERETSSLKCLETRLTVLRDHERGKPVL